MRPDRRRVRPATDDPGARDSVASNGTCATAPSLAEDPAAHCRGDAPPDIWLSATALSAIHESLGEPVLVADTTLRTVMVNSACERLFGYRSHELTGRTTEFLYADVGDYGRIVERLRRGETTFPAPVCYRRRDGSTFWGEASVTPVRLHGEMIGVVGIMRDVTDRIAAERELQEARDRFELMFRTAPLAMAFGDLETEGFTDVNGAFESLCGRQRANLLGRDGCELGLCIDAEFHSRAMRELRETGQARTYQTRLRRADGVELDVTLSLCRVSLKGRLHFLAMLIDITEREEARRVVECSRQQLEELVRSRTSQLEAANAELQRRAAEIADLYDRAPCGYHSLLPDGTIAATNATELAMLGYDRDEYVGHSIHEFMTPASRQAFFTSFARFRLSGEVRDMEFEFVRKDGSVLPVLISAVMVRDEQGRHVGGRATMVDNSERKIRDQQIEAMQHELERRAEMAETANRAKSAFLANMSHEIRTPLNAIIGMTHLIEGATSDPVQSTRLVKVQNAAHHLLNLLDDVLDVSKIEAGKLVLEEAEFALDEVLSKARGLVAEQARKKGLELRVDAGEAPRRLVGDATRLAQALINLVSNAVKFTPAGSVRLQVRTVSVEGAKALLRFEVTDTGPGVAASAQPLLFQPFQQADVSTTRRHGGTGLGLALTRELATLMGGEAGLQSSEGAGSTFWFSAKLGLPKSAADDVPSTAVDERLPASLRTSLQLAHAGRRVLVAEDNAVNQEVAAALLASVGLVPVLASDGVEALRLVSSERFDAVLMDVQMPGVDGLEATRRIRESGYVSLPIIATTANAFADDRAACLAAGMNDHLPKPVAPLSLYAALLRWLPSDACGNERR